MIETAGSDYVLRAISGELDLALSAPFDVNASVPLPLTLLDQPSSSLLDPVQDTRSTAPNPIPAVRRNRLEAPSAVA